MPDPRRSAFQPFVRVPQVRAPGDNLVLAVGSRGLLAAEQVGGAVQIASDDGSTVVGTLRDGAEVEIIAWRPRRSGGTWYRVRPTAGGVEGWLAAARLRPVPAPAKAKARPKVLAPVAPSPKRPVKRRTSR